MPAPNSSLNRFIAWLSDEPFLVPLPLAKVLASQTDLCQVILALRPRHLRASDRARIDQIDTRVQQLLGTTHNERLLPKWKEVVARLYTLCDYGVTGRIETITAILLAGAAIARTDIAIVALRPGLDTKLLDECKRSRSSSPPQPAHPFAQAYAKLQLDTRRPRLRQAFEKIITDQTRGAKLRLGPELAALDLAAIETMRVRFLGSAHRSYAAGQRHGALNTGGLAVPALTAPDKVSLRLDRATCVHQQDSTGSDETFWVGYFTRPRNVAALYAKIDQAIQSGNLGQVDLDVDPVTTVVSTPLLSYATGQQRALGATIGEVDLVQGFGPWYCQVVGYEDDNQEYVAVQEVLGQISDVAGAVQAGASYVAAVSGPTVAAAGAAAVASCAGAVQVAADVTKALVGVANFFDENDTLGSQGYPGRADYLRQPVADVPYGVADLGLYRLEATESCVGPLETVTRQWEVTTTYGEGTKEVNEGGYWPGIKEDYDVNFKMDGVTDALVNWDIAHVCLDEGGDGDTGHGEWAAGPYLSIDKLTVTGRMHVGQDGWGKISDTPWASGVRVTTPL